MVTHAAEVVFHAWLIQPTVPYLICCGATACLPGKLRGRFRPAISKHLRLLRRANLVRRHRSGRHRFYHLNPQSLKAVDLWLEHYRVFWHTKLEA